LSVAHGDNGETELREPMIGVCGDKFTQSADGLLVVAFDEVLRFELQQFPIPVAAVIEGLARVQNDLLFLKETSAVQQQTYVEVRVLGVEKLLQQRQDPAPDSDRPERNAFSSNERSVEPIDLDLVEFELELCGDLSNIHPPDDAEFVEHRLFVYLARWQLHMTMSLPAPSICR
jgi:hypothetical protein